MPRKQEEMKIYEWIRIVSKENDAKKVTKVTKVTSTPKATSTGDSRGYPCGYQEGRAAVTKDLSHSWAEGDCLPRPYITGTELIIPFRSSRKYHWWDEGQSVLETLRELDAPGSVMKHYLTVI